MNNVILIDRDFPGGNIVVERQEGDQLWLHQDLRDTVGDWFYWYFRVRGAASRTLTFHFTKSKALGVRGPAVSLDAGITWQWLGIGNEPVNSFRFSFPDHAEEVRFSFGMPYQYEHWDAFTARHPRRLGLVQAELCRSRKGRLVPYAQLGCLTSAPDHRVAITCRHHCCEMMANYVLEGLLSFVLSDSGQEAQWLRSRVEFLVVPFVDADGVEDGDQGKNRHPRDHGRDYLGTSLYPSVRALRELLPAWSQGRLTVALDLHCPWICGPHNEAIYLVGSSDPRNAQQQKIFSLLLESHAQGDLSFSASDFLPFGTSWNKAENYNYDTGKSFNRWAVELPDMRLASGIEIPYANSRGQEVNQQTARSFGVDLGRTLAAFLKTDRRTESQTGCGAEPSGSA